MSRSSTPKGGGEPDDGGSAAREGDRRTSFRNDSAGRTFSIDVRGQTEPIASLVAVAALGLALATYGLYISDTLPGTSERTLERPTQDRVAHALSANGAVDPEQISGSEWEVGDGPVDLATVLDPADLPNGRHVYVEVTLIDRTGDRAFVGRAQFGTDGEPAGTIDRLPPSHEDFSRTRRAIPVRLEPGTVTGGQLTVEVWK